MRKSKLGGWKEEKFECRQDMFKGRLFGEREETKSTEKGSVGLHDGKQGHRTESWWTAQEEVYKDEKVLSQLMWKERDHKYD